MDTQIETTATEVRDTTAGWPTKLEAGAILGVSTKTIEKYVAAGKLEQRMQNRVNLAPRAVINPVELKRMQDQKTAASVPEKRPSLDSLMGVREGGSEGSSAPVLPSLLTALERVRWGKPVYMTTEQAVDYSGLPASYLGHLVREGKLKRLEDTRPYRYRTADLEAL